MGLSMIPAAAQTSTPQQLIQIDEAQSGIDLAVTGLTGVPFVESSITLMGENLKTAITGRTDEAGKWQVRGLAPGQYSLLVTAQGFSPRMQPVVIADRRVSSLRVDLTLEQTGFMGEIVVVIHRNPVQKVIHFFTRR